MAKVRGRVWRSSGATLGRILFHLERYGIPAPRLFAFGQREDTGESFVLFDAQPGEAVPADELLQKLHDAGCRLVRPDLLCIDGGRVSICDPRAARLDRKLSARARRADFARIQQLIG